MRILVADDDLISRRLVESALTKAGYAVESAGDGERAAAALCSQDGPRLALLDWMMPGLDGPAVCREVRRRHSQPYVYMILLTSKEEKSDVIAGLEAGADDYLTKPFHAAELRARLRTGQRILELEDSLVEAREQMRFKATHDPLTSLWNRGFILDHFQRELQRVRRERSSLAVLLCDLDHFKAINDTHGHLVGDEVLRESARRLLASVRTYDAVGRYGGEEFLVVLSGCESSNAQQRAEQIRKAFAQRPVNTGCGPISITTSIGALASRDWTSASAQTLLSEADAALYQAKSSGRNCVVLTKPAAEHEAEEEPRVTGPPLRT
ncbi:MAG: hypothetical protein AUI53_01695 [Acidobacteria bacterium 13_1_40CM_2_60_7]|nr:MAG: hypothetical protein AUH88_04805 [Acidobacteria bacterium 13_1_40CM_4_61_5]OLD62369.1 MAG: hypothetical protein AUI53_01695 [Acidobacteria bacterium 13_1_40CM_2_60_7]OLE86185.1 MAG: hypothetical protein AUG07_02985 [Acidobacteria bacterium 13_1_20CM_2_60_10]